VRIPRIHWGHTTSRVLTMERIEGPTLNSPAIASLPLEERHTLAAAIADCWFKQILGDGFFHGDPHPANIAYLGDGPLRSELEGRRGVRLLGSVAHERVPDWIAACDVLCQPSLVEPFGLATLEGLACGRPVVATRVGGPPEFVPAGGGVLVDPLDTAAIVSALGEAASLARPNSAAMAAAEGHDIKKQAARIEGILVRAAATRRS